jgi:murein DD-endopeptidase MepM/ murein hydrolase activator NlpD
MAGQPLIATITGIPNVLDVNVRSGPSRDFQAVFKSPKGTTGLRVIEVQIDGKGEALQGKTYQWFRLQFPDGQTGWVRDDLISVVGDGAQFGYGIFTAPAVPFYVLRTATTRAAGTMSPQPAQVVAQPVVVQPAPTVTVTTPTTLPSPTSAGTSTQVTVQTVQTPPAAVVATPQATVSTPQTVATPQVTVAAPAVTVTVSTPQPNQGPASLICMNKGGANLRPGPGVNYNPVTTRMNFRDTAPILEVKQGEPNDYFKWIKVNYQGKQAWVREDFGRLTGTFGTFGYPEDAYPCPVPDAWWVRDYDETGQVSGVVHYGWDHAGNIGTSIYAGPKGGVVTKTMLCQKCGSEGASTVDKGFSLSDSRVLSDASWNYGYGHYLIVRYDNALLPASTHNYLGTKGWSGYHAFVMYAHLSKILCSEGQSVGPNQEIAKLGNSGNSSGAHLHLELRFGKDANSQWPNIRNALVSPVHLFLR